MFQLREPFDCISIHALHEESDPPPANFWKWPSVFQSTLSMRRATSAEGRCRNAGRISIHALHEESDTCSKRSSDDIKISIHALHEESDFRSMIGRSRLS